MFGKKMVSVALASVVVMGVSASAASADTIQKSVNGTWSNLAVGDRIEGSASPATLSTNIGNINCASDFLSTVTDNPGSNAGLFPADDAEIQINPAVARSPLDYLTFTGCTDTIPFIVVNSATISGDIDGRADADGAQETVSLVGITVNVNTSVGVCTYSGNVTGVLNEPNQTLTFTGQNVAKTAGSGLCPSSGAFSATYDLVGTNPNTSVAYDELRLIN